MIAHLAIVYGIILWEKNHKKISVIIDRVFY